MKEQERNDEVMKAAFEVFAEYGYRKATLDDIAQRLGLTKSALYLYSDGKRDLYEKCVGRALIEWQSYVADAVAKEENVCRKFVALCQSSFDWLLNNRDMQMILSRDPNVFPLFGEDDPYFEINQKSIKMLDDVLERGVAEGRFRPIDREVVTNLLFWIYKMVIIGTCVTPDAVDVRRLINGGLDVILHGVFVPGECG
ncbi:MAG: TetR/AcrR family transcriptional regulator [Bacillota bacterium]|nr:TetR/AcrR family transcriptional regulator [Bacillota bacterium]HOB42269.1 TetR/AcrR family transcriptional regulator [Bacillota bacterium]HOK70043.1 TetR/AcrR family transcriptional regulator [Bacillota bacterium]HOL51199.1 TetR/AcrR family transcriptional regulator [Bacillota bacterium]HOO29978.1 TetR/AcrR family transcriptional regulator [Bacillota bacterium]